MVTDIWHFFHNLKKPNPPAPCLLVWRGGIFLPPIAGRSQFKQLCLPKNLSCTDSLTAALPGVPSGCNWEGTESENLARNLLSHRLTLCRGRHLFLPKSSASELPAHPNSRDREIREQYCGNN